MYGNHDVLPILLKNSDGSNEGGGLRGKGTRTNTK